MTDVNTIGTKPYGVFMVDCHNDMAKNIEYYTHIKTEGNSIFGVDPDNYEKRAAALHFIFTISPVNQDVDITTLTRQVMSRLETYTGAPLDWIGTNDQWYDNMKRSLVLVNGYDLNNKPFDLKVKYLEGIEDFLKNSSTEQIGQ